MGGGDMGPLTMESEEGPAAEQPRPKTEKMRRVTIIEVGVRMGKRSDQTACAYYPRSLQEDDDDDEEEEAEVETAPVIQQDSVQSEATDGTRGGSFRKVPIVEEDDDDEEEEEEDGGLTTPTESTTTAPAAEARDVQDMQRVKVEGGPGEGEVVTAQDEAGAAVTGRSPSPHAAPLETAAVQPEAPSRLAFRKVEIQEEDDDEDEEEGGEDGAVETAKEAAPPSE